MTDSTVRNTAATAHADHFARLDALENRARRAFEAADNRPAIEATHAEYLGGKGCLCETAQESLRALPPDLRRDYGRQYNRVKATLESAHAASQERLAGASASATVSPNRRDAMGAMFGLALLPMMPDRPSPNRIAADATNPTTANSNLLDWSFYSNRGHDLSVEELALRHPLHRSGSASQYLVVQGLIQEPRYQSFPMMFKGEVFWLPVWVAKVGFGSGPLVDSGRRRSLPTLQSTSTTLQKTFYLPPDDGYDHPAYMYGKLLDTIAGTVYQDDIPERHSLEYYQFMHAMGFDYPRGGSLPPEVRYPRNWIGRVVTAVGDPAKYSLEAKGNGGDSPLPDRIKAFSFQRA